MTSPIDRRDFFRFTAISTGAISLPAWLAAAFSPQDPEHRDSDRAAALRKARERAVARGKPLLVFVVPADPHLWDRGQLLGAFLNHGGPETLLDLALCEPACATPADIQRVFPKTRVDDSALMVVIETERPTHTRVVAPELEAPPAREEFADWQTWQEAAEKHLKERIAKIHATLRDAVAGDPAALAARADAVRPHLTDAERERIEAFVAGTVEELEAQLLLDAAAVVRMAAAAPRRPEDPERLRNAVATAARSVYVTERIPGSKWATTMGCGVTVEGEKDDGLAIACGMGSVPPLSQRFLYFYSDR